MSSNDSDIDEGRRDFIHLLACGTAAAAGAGVVIPLVSQMMPAADVRALATKEVSVADVAPGQAFKVIWQGKPVFLRRLTAPEIETNVATPLSALKDDESRNKNAEGEPATEEFRTVTTSIGGEDRHFAVVVGVCTHLGCVPLGTEQGEDKGDFDGWFCPCHGSHYDAFGRIRKGPAPTNLEVPPLEFVSETTVRLG